MHFAVLGELLKQKGDRGVKRGGLRAAAGSHLLQRTCSAADRQKLVHVLVELCESIVLSVSKPLHPPTDDASLKFQPQLKCLRRDSRQAVGRGKVLIHHLR